MKRHKPIKKWHMAFTSKKLIDTIGIQLNCNTWHFKKKKFHPITPSHERPLWTRGQLMVYQKCMSRFVQKGRSWEGIEEIRREKRARRQLPRPSLKKGRMSILDPQGRMSILDPPSMIHACPQLPRPSLIKDGRAYWTLNKHALRQKRKGQTIIFWSETSTNPYETPVQIK